MRREIGERLPNMRVQRPRAARFARQRSPLTRRPLGDPMKATEETG
jgi:hypothetical protein